MDGDDYLFGGDDSDSLVGGLGDDTLLVTRWAGIPVGALGEALSDELAAEYGNRHILRVVTHREGDAMYYATDCPEGTKLWLTTRDEDLIFREMDRIVATIRQRIHEAQPVAVFHADCLARGRFLFNRIIKDDFYTDILPEQGIHPGINNEAGKV
jgi:Ca2+-binding RTX toxin-like protein